MMATTSCPWLLKIFYWLLDMVDWASNEDWHVIKIMIKSLKDANSV
jgi:hypothetical protein